MRDIMPNLKSKIRTEPNENMAKSNTIKFIDFSKQFSHFVTSPYFLEYLEVSDYLEIRRGCKYLRECFDYNVLEDLIKFGNLDDSLRKNLWMNVSPVTLLQSKYRRKLNIGSVFCNVYTKIIEIAEHSHDFTTYADERVEEFRKIKELNTSYEPDDFEVLRNLTLAFMYLFPENRIHSVTLFDALYQGCGDEEMAFWILLCITENKGWNSWLCSSVRTFKHKSDVKTLNLLAQEYCPNFHRLMTDTNQIDLICENLLSSLGCDYFEFNESLPIVDSYLVCGWKGFYERLVIVFLHLETLIEECIDDDTKSSIMVSQSRNKSKSHHAHKSSKIFLKPMNDNIDSLKIDSIQEYFNSSISMQDMLIKEKEELKFQSLIEIIEEFNKAYIISITDENLTKVRKQAIKHVTESQIESSSSSEFNSVDYIRIKAQIKVWSDKYNDDIKTIDKKFQNVLKNIEFEQKELSDIEKAQICYNRYGAYMQTYEHLSEKIEILKETQIILNKEIWRKKQLLKIMYTNKSFIKKSSRNTNNTYDYASYSYNGKGISYTEEFEPKDDFLYERRKSNANNNSFNSSQRGVSITPEMKNKSIQEEAREIDKLKFDVDNIEEKINLESQCIDFYFEKYQEAKNAYEDKKAVISNNF